MTQKSRVLAALLSAAGVVLVLVSASSHQSPSRTNGAKSEEAMARFMSTSRTDISLTARDQAQQAALVYGAEQALISECMLKAGLPYWADSTPVVSTVSLFPYGLTDLQWAMSYGFGEAVSEAYAHDVAYSDELQGTKLEKYTKAINGAIGGNSNVTVRMPGGAILGHSSNGCQASSDQTLYGSYRQWFTYKALYQAYQGMTEAVAIRRDRSYRSGTDRWSVCMRAVGYKYSTPLQAMNAFPLIASTPTTTEISTAVAEVKCMATTGLSEIVMQMIKKDSISLENEHHQVAVEYSRLQEAAVRNAPSILRRACLGSAKSYINACLKVS